MREQLWKNEGRVGGRETLLHKKARNGFSDQDAI